MLGLNLDCLETINRFLLDLEREFFIDMIGLRVIATLAALLSILESLMVQLALFR